MANRLVLIVLFLASVGLFVVVIEPMRRENKLLIDEREKLNEALEKARELQAVSKDLEEKVKNISVEDLGRLNRLLPAHVDNVRLIIDIDQIASRYGLAIDSLEFTTQNDTSGSVEIVETQRSVFARPVVEESTGVGPVEEVALQSLTFEFTVVSSYGQFLAFLRDLEKSLRLVDITGIEFFAKDEDLYDFKVKIVTYWMD